MFALLQGRIHQVAGRYLENERGEVLTWFLVIAVLWLVLSGSRVVVQ